MGPPEIMVDSGIEESMWLAGCTRRTPALSKCRAPLRGVRWPSTAGSKSCCGEPKVGGQTMCLGFEAMDVAKPSAAARRIIDRGNGAGWAKNIASGKSRQLVTKGGCCVLNAGLLTDIGADWRPTVGFHLTCMSDSGPRVAGRGAARPAAR